MGCDAREVTEHWLGCRGVVLALRAPHLVLCGTLRKRPGSMQDLQMYTGPPALTVGSLVAVYDSQLTACLGSDAPLHPPCGMGNVAAGSSHGWHTHLTVRCVYETLAPSTGDAWCQVTCSFVVWCCCGTCAPPACSSAAYVGCRHLCQTEMPPASGGPSLVALGS